MMEYFNDNLIIEKGKETISFDISFGFLDRSFTAFDFESQKNENIDGYNLTLDTEKLSNFQIKELENVMNKMNTLHQITLNLDGIVKKGKARIAQSFGIGGVSIDLEIHS